MVIFKKIGLTVVRENVLRKKYEEKLCRMYWFVSLAVIRVGKHNEVVTVVCAIALTWCIDCITDHQI